MEFIYNSDHEVSLDPGQMVYLHEGDTLESQVISYEVKKDGYYRFTGVWFFYLFK